MGGHSARVSSLAWNRHILTSGGKDANIIQHDVRVANHAITSLQGHTQEVGYIHEETNNIIFYPLLLLDAMLCISARVSVGHI